jgi:hypothetical protein
VVFPSNLILKYILKKKKKIKKRLTPTPLWMTSL